MKINHWLKKIVIIIAIIFSTCIIFNLSSCNDTNISDSEYTGNDNGTNWKGYISGQLIIEFKDNQTCVVRTHSYYTAKNLIIPHYVIRSENREKYEVIIGNSCFNNYPGLSGEITFPKNIVIEENAFARNTNLNKITIENASIGEKAFYGCEEVTKVSIQAGRIETQAFLSCNKLSILELGKDIQYIDGDAFLLCDAINIININMTNIPDYLFKDKNSLSEIRFGSNVLTIGTSSFENCPNLVDLRLNETNITTIGERAFANCANIISPTLNTRYIRKEAFKNCYAITNLFLQDGVQYIGEEAFVGTSITGNCIIPRTVAVIDTKAFYDINFNNVKFTDSNSDLLVEIGERAFAKSTPGNNTLRPIEINRKVLIKSYGFELNTGINSLYIKRMQGSIVDVDAFRDCWSTPLNPKFDLDLTGQITFRNWCFRPLMRRQVLQGFSGDDV